MTDDVVARLRSWVTDWNGAAMVRGEPPRDGLHCDDVYDAIDEIVALRRRCALHDDLEFVSKNELTQVRADALEEAARVCEGGYTTGSTASTLKAVAAAIRKLKDKA